MGIGDSKILLVGSLVILAIIGTFFASVSIEETTSENYSMDLEINNSAFHDICVGNNGEWANYGNCKFSSEEDLKSAQVEYGKEDFHWIEGAYAEKICEIVDIPCPVNVKFNAHLDVNDNVLAYSYISKNKNYNFKTNDTSLSYFGKQLIDEKWVSMKQWEHVEILPATTTESKSMQDGYSAVFEFDGDELGNYLEWCIENNGLWTKESLRNVICEYITSEDHKTARHSLDTLVNVSIQGKVSKDLCEFLKKYFCDEEVSFGAKFDMRTGYVMTRDSIGDDHYEIRVNGDTIQYRPNTFEDENSYSWVTFKPTYVYLDSPKSSTNNWNEGQITWLEKNYSSDGAGVVRITDPDMNLNSEHIDSFITGVRSNSDLTGIDITVTETGDNTGIFEGTVFFSTDYDSSGDVLQVSEDDIIFAEYVDTTSPLPYVLDKIVYTAISRIETPDLK